MIHVYYQSLYLFELVRSYCQSYFGLKLTIVFLVCLLMALCTIQYSNDG